MTIRRRLSLAAASAVAVAVAIAAVGAYFAVQARMRDEIDSSLRQRAHETQAIGDFVAHRLPKPPLPPAAGHPPEARFGGAAGLLQFVTSRGKVPRPPGAGGPLLPVTRSTKAVAAGTAGAFFQDETVQGQHLRVFTAPLRKGVAVEVARPLNEVDSVLHDLILILAAITVGGVGLAAVLGGLISRTSLAPNRRFTTETEAVSHGHDLSRRLPVAANDELGRLARSYNTTLDALERSADTQRQLVSDASHELRTPLASLKTNIEVLLRQNGKLSSGDRVELERHLVEQVDDLTLLVDDVVELARRGEPAQHLDDVALDEIVRECLARVQRHSPGLQFECKLEPCTVRGVPDRLGRAVYNLLDNAAKWSQPGGRIEVHLDEAGVLTVRDHGPGIREEDLPLIFDRFYRAPDARGRPGSGLGLAIVRQIADAHGAAVSAANAPGGGAVLTLDFAAQTVPAQAPAGAPPGPPRASS